MSVVVTGIGAVADEPCDPTPFLLSRKTRKYMGKQDELAVVAAARALQSAGLGNTLGERCGLYLSVGYIPFERSDCDALSEASMQEGAFSMARFATNAFDALHPLLTFHVLPNMPAFHVSLNFDIQGPYTVTYPGIGQFYLALEEAFAALEARAIDIALVGAVADQRNYLVEHHFSRIEPPVNAGMLADGAGFLVLEREEDAGERAVARRTSWQVRYAPVDPFESTTAHLESFGSLEGCDTAGWKPALLFGPASLAIGLASAVSPASRQRDGRRAAGVTHSARTCDGFEVASTWELA